MLLLNHLAGTRTPIASVNKECDYTCILLQYGLWSFPTGATKLERYLPKNQHTQSKLLNFENWVNGGLRSFQLLILMLLLFFINKLKFFCQFSGKKVPINGLEFMLCYIQIMFCIKILPKFYHSLVR